MIIRRYTKADIPEMVTFLEDGLKGFHYKKIHYSAQKIEDLLTGNLRNPEFFCHIIVVDGHVVGALAAMLMEYQFSYEAFASTLITYVREGHGSLKGITGLVAAYKIWARRMGAREIRWDQSTGFKIEKFAVLAKRCGFTQIGTNWRMEL